MQATTKIKMVTGETPFRLPFGTAMMFFSTLLTKVLGDGEKQSEKVTQSTLVVNKLYRIQDPPILRTQGQNKRDFRKIDISLGAQEEIIQIIY